MPGQPDWQRYQTSAGPLIYLTANNNNPGFSNTYMGSWRSYFLTIQPQDPASLWNIIIDWYETNDLTQPVLREIVTVGNNAEYKRQRPVMARYMVMSTQITIHGTTDQLTVWLAPSLLDIFPGYQLDNSILVEGVNQTIPANTTVPYKLGLIRGGQMKMVVWQTSTSLRYNIRWFHTDNSLGYLAVASFATTNVVNELIFMSPESPVTIEVVNTDATNAHLLHIFVYQWS